MVHYTKYMERKCFTLFFLLIALSSGIMAQTQSVTWSATAANNYKSTQTICRANEGYVETSTPLNYFIGLSSAATPTSISSMDYGLYFKGTAPKQIQLFEGSTLLKTYDAASLQATDKVRLERSGSVLNVYYKPTASSTYTLVLTHNSDANLFYRFYLNAPSGGTTSALGAIVTNTWVNPCSSVNTPATDPTLNWQHSAVFDGGQGDLVQVGESRAYQNRFGDVIQTQVRDFSQTTQAVMGIETVFDAQKRPVLNTLPAPTGNQNIAYKSKFLQATDGTSYEFEDFDLPISSNAAGEVNNPKPVGTQSGTVGAYYSSAYTSDGLIPVSSFPYNRVEFGANGAIKRVSGTGENYRMGSTHETTSYTVNSGNELNYLYGARKSFEVSPDPADPLANMSNKDIAQNLSATKIVNINPDGIKTIQFYSASGLLLAQCVSGSPEPHSCPKMPVKHTLYQSNRAQQIDAFGTNSVSIHLPASSSNTLKLKVGGSTIVEKTFSPSKAFCGTTTTGYTGSLEQNILIHLYDLAAGKPMTKGTDYNLTLSGLTYTVNFIGNYANKEGFYRISYDYTCEYYKYIYGNYHITGYEDPMIVSYELDYSNWTLNYYDEDGRLRKSVAPEGLGGCNLGSPAQYAFEQTYSLKDLYASTAFYTLPFTTFSTTLNNDLAADYGPFLSFKVFGKIKSGVVTGPSGGNGTTDVSFNENSEFLMPPAQARPNRPSEGGYHLLFEPASDFYVVYAPPTESHHLNLDYPFTSSAIVLNDPNNDDIPSSCTNGVLDPGEILVDYGGPCGNPYQNDACYDPPTELVSFEIKLEFKVSNVTRYTQYLYRTLGTNCKNKIVEMDNPAGLPYEIEQYIKNTELGTGTGINVKIDVAEIKVKDATGAYSIAYNPASVVNHRFIRYILLKTNLEKETLYKKDTAYSLKSSWHYDKLGRTLASLDPDRGKKEFIYDDEGKLRFSQDARQRELLSSQSLSCFSYYAYDAQGRITETGEYRRTTGASTFMFPNAYYESDATSCTAASTYCLLYPALRNTILGYASKFGSYRFDVNNYYYDFPALPAGAPTAYATKFGEGRLTKIENAEQSTCYRYNHIGQVTGAVVAYKTLGADDIGIKTFDYEYDYFGRLKKSVYQKNSASETFAHLYTYNANGQIISVETADKTDPAQKQLRNTYYKNGALKRSVLGVATQGLDYVYTIDGRLKSVNHPMLDNKDPGNDGFGIAGPTTTPLDIFAYSLDYHQLDYVRPGSNISYGDDPGSSSDRFDGRIKSQRWNTRHAAVQAPSGKETMYKYEYDWEQNLALTTFGNFTPGTTNNTGGSGGYTAPVYGTFTPQANNGYREQMKDTDVSTDPSKWYDLNGNIKNLKRFKGDGTVIDNLTYQYTTGTNQLLQVGDISNYTGTDVNHVITQVPNNYTYNANGDIATDAERNISITYNAYGLISEVRRTPSNLLVLKFYYDANGKRIRKTAYDAAGAVEKNTLYIREPDGSVFCVFEDRVRLNPATYVRTEINLDGGSIGTFYTESPGKYVYRLSDHLGNVRATIDRNNNGATPTILSYADYYAWGLTLPGREMTSSPKYRLGYQGQEYESKVGMYGFSLRMYDQRLGRWFASDPYAQHWSPYLAMSNNPISFVDPDGGFDGISHWFAHKDDVNYFVDGMQVSEGTFRGWFGIRYDGSAESLNWGGNISEEQVAGILKTMSAGYFINTTEIVVGSQSNAELTATDPAAGISQVEIVNKWISAPTFHNKAIMERNGGGQPDNEYIRTWNTTTNKWDYIKVSEWGGDDFDVIHTTSSFAAKPYETQVVYAPKYSYRIGPGQFGSVGKDEALQDYDFSDLIPQKGVAKGVTVAAMKLMVRGLIKRGVTKSMIVKQTSTKVDYLFLNRSEAMNWARKELGHNTQKIYDQSGKLIGWKSAKGTVYWGHGDWGKGVGSSTFPHLNYSINGIKGHLFLQDKIVNRGMWIDFSKHFGL